MGQYYKAYVRNDEERVYCPQNAVFLTRNGIASTAEAPDNITKSNGFWDDFSGLKLTEHSWIRNDFCNGVIEQVWDNPSRVAWVGDYADDNDDFNEMYTREVYGKVWGAGEDDNERSFDGMPHVHMLGLLVNRTKGVYLDMAQYVLGSMFRPSWDEGRWWCVHPLPILTCIGNGRGGGDYYGKSMRKVGSWAMDEIEYTLDVERVDGLVRLDAYDYRFIEE